MSQFGIISRLSPTDAFSFIIGYENFHFPLCKPVNVTRIDVQVFKVSGTPHGRETDSKTSRVHDQIKQTVENWS